MSIISIIQEGVVQAVKNLYSSDVTADSVTMNVTRKEFEGDYTVVVFPYSRVARKKPEQIGEDLGEFLVKNVEHIESYNVIKGFLNLSVSNQFWVNFLEGIADDKNYGKHPSTGKKVMVEFSSPNTNKPLHLGHIRNILLGWSVAKLFQAAGYEVVKTQIVNDRGIAICKTMLAWSRFGKGETPESSSTKGDHFVGKYYVKFATCLKDEYVAWQKTDEAKDVYNSRKKEAESEVTFFNNYKNDYFNEFSELGAAAKEMLIKWEAGDEETVTLWKKMNGWVLAGFEDTYKKLGVDFDILYFESNTYLLGKEIIEDGIKKEVFVKEGKRVWTDLEKIGLGKKTIIKSDGTSTYSSQDLGTAQLRWKDYGTERMIYVVGDEQIAHFQGLFEMLKKLGEPYAEGLFHLAYGMVDLPTGRMKSREGTVVDADDLVAEVIAAAKIKADEIGGIVDLPEAQQADIVRKLGLAALKYFILKVDPRKGMVFNPEESVDFQGDTGPYIQYSSVRIKGITQRGITEGVDLNLAAQYTDLQTIEKDLLNQLYQFPDLVLNAAENYSPALIANFCFDIAKNYSRLWSNLPVFNAEENAKAFRLKLSKAVGNVLEFGMNLLGIEMPEKM